VSEIESDKIRAAHTMASTATFFWWVVLILVLVTFIVLTVLAFQYVPEKEMTKVVIVAVIASIAGIMSFALRHDSKRKLLDARSDAENEHATWKQRIEKLEDDGMSRCDIYRLFTTEVAETERTNALRDTMASFRSLCTHIL